MADLLHVRIVVAAARCRDVVEYLEQSAAAFNVTVQSDAFRQPLGDLVQLDVQRDGINAVLDELERLGVAEEGSISVFHPALTLNDRADEVETDEAEIVVWDEVSARLHQAVRPTGIYLAFFAVAAVIASAGVLYDSPILIVGAMVVGPEYGPLVAMAYGVFDRDGRLLLQGLGSLLAGTLLAIATSFVVGLLSRAFDEVPVPYATDNRPLTDFITNPDTFTVLVAAVAAVAGTLALVRDQAGTLVGVLISVTTIPAIAEVGVGLAFRNFEDVRGAAVQLAINITCIIVVSVATLTILRRRGVRKPASRTPDVPLGYRGRWNATVPPSTGPRRHRADEGGRRSAP